MRCSGRLGHARALAGAGAAAEAEELLAAVRPGSDAEWIALALARARNLFWALGRRAEAEAVLADTEPRVTDPSELLALRARFALAVGDPAAAIAAANCARNGVATAALSQALAITGQAGRALAVLGDEPTGELAGAAAFAHWLAGDHEAATEAADRAYETAPAIGALRLGQAWLARDEVATALQWFRESAALLRASDPNAIRGEALAGIAQAAAQAGDAQHAAAAIAGLTHDFPELAIARAWTAYAQGDTPTARRLARAVARDAQQFGAFAIAARAERELARLT